VLLDVGYDERENEAGMEARDEMNEHYINIAVDYVRVLALRTKQRDEARAWARKLYRQGNELAETCHRFIRKAGRNADLLYAAESRIIGLEDEIHEQAAYIARLEAAVRDAEYFAHKDADARKLRDELRARG
jgi:hypothetical protein